jgi:hypothetical protein
MKALLFVIVGLVVIIFFYRMPFDEDKAPFLYHIRGYLSGTALLLIGIAMLFGAC